MGHRVGLHLIDCGLTVNTFTSSLEEMSMALSTLSRHRERTNLMIKDIVIQYRLQRNQLCCIWKIGDEISLRVEVNLE